MNVTQINSGYYAEYNQEACCS